MTRTFHIGLSVLLTAVATVLLFSLLGLPMSGIDDANITFVYARHLVDGAGLVYNVGGEWVEGFTSVTGMLTAALGYVFVAAPEWLLTLANVLLVGFAIGIAGRCIQQQVPAGTVLFYCWVFALPTYFVWGTASLLETGIYSALLLMLVTVQLQVVYANSLSRQQAVVFSGLLIALLLTRPDAMAWALAFLTSWALILRWRGISGRQFVGLMCIPLIAAAACLLALTAFRWQYFGYPLPNTYYAKVSPDRLYNIVQGLKYSIGFVVNNPLAGALFLVAAVAGLSNLIPALRALLSGSKTLSAERLAVFLLSALLLSGLTIVVLMGGDYFSGFRFFQPVWPLLVLLLIFVAAGYRPAWLQWSNGAVQRVCIAVVLLFSSGVTWFNLHADPHWYGHQWDIAGRGRLMGTELQKIFANEGLPSLGVTAAGGTKMTYPGEVVDLLGLNYTPMAHAPGDRKGITAHASFNKDVFWQNPPGLVEPMLCRSDKLENAYADPENWSHRILKGLPADERFIEKYAYAAIETPDPDVDWWVCTLIDRELLGRLQAGSGQIVSD